MPIYLVEMWIPKDGKESECIENIKRILKYIKEHRNEFKERKSHRIYRVFIGDKPWFIDIQEYEDLKSMEELDKKISKDREYLKLIIEWKKCIDTKESKSLLLFDVFKELWIE